MCLVTKGEDLKDVHSVSLDASSLTSVVLTKIIFREFLGFEPKWIDAQPDIDAMLVDADCALLIGDPALSIAECGMRSAESNPKSKIQNPKSYDLAELWHKYTSFGFVFAMWMTRQSKCEIDFAAARDEGLEHLDEIIANYETDIRLGTDEMKQYLSQNISYSIDDSMRRGMELYFKLAAKNGLVEENKSLRFV